MDQFHLHLRLQPIALGVEVHIIGGSPRRHAASPGIQQSSPSHRTRNVHPVAAARIHAVLVLVHIDAITVVSMLLHITIPNAHAYPLAREPTPTKGSRLRQETPTAKDAPLTVQELYLRTPRLDGGYVRLRGNTLGSSHGHYHLGHPERCRIAQHRSPLMRKERAYLGPIGILKPTDHQRGLALTPTGPLGYLATLELQPHLPLGG